MGTKPIILSIVAAGLLNAAPTLEELSNPNRSGVDITITNDMSNENILQTFQNVHSSAWGHGGSVIYNNGITTADKDGMNGAGAAVMKDNLKVTGTADTKITKALEGGSEWIQRTFWGANADIKYADLSNLNIHLGDRIYLEFIDPLDGNVKYFRLYAVVNNTSGNMNLSYSNLSNGELEANKTTIDNSVLTDFSITTNELNLTNSTIKVTNENDIWFDVYTKASGSNNYLEIEGKGEAALILKGDVAQNFITTKESTSGISNIKPTIVYAKTKDGYTIFYANTTDDKSFGEYIEQTTDETRNIATTFFLDEEPILNKDGSLGLPQTNAYYKIFKQLGIIDELGVVNYDEITRQGKSLEDIINANMTDFVGDKKTYDLAKFADDKNALNQTIDTINKRAWNNGHGLIGGGYDNNGNLVDTKFDVYHAYNFDDKEYVEAKLNFLGVSNDDVIIKGTKENPITIDFQRPKPTNVDGMETSNSTTDEIDEAYLNASNVDIAYSNLSNINLNVGDDMLFKFKDTDGKNKYMQLGFKKNNSRGNVNILNSKLTNFGMLANKLTLDTVEMNSSSALANDINISNATLSNDTFIAAAQNLSGENNTLDNAVVVAKNSNALNDNIFRAATTSVGLSTVGGGLETFITKDGYKVWRVISKDENSYKEEWEKFLAHTLNKDNFVTPMMLLHEIVDANGNIKNSIDPKIKLVLEQNQILNSDGSVNVDKLYENSLDIYNVVSMNPSLPNTGGSNPYKSQNVPDVSLIKDNAMILDGLPNVYIKNNPNIKGLEIGSAEERLFNAMYAEPTKYTAFDESATYEVSVNPAKLNKIEINSTNFRSDNKGFDKIASKETLNVVNSRIEGLDLIAGENLTLTSAGQNYIFQDAMKSGSGKINLVNASISEGDIKADTINVFDTFVTKGAIFANKLNANRLTITDGGGFIYGSATGKNNTLKASAEALKYAATGKDTDEPISIVFVKDGADNLFEVESTETGISTIKPNSIQGITKDGFKVFAIGSKEWINNITDTDGSIKLNALALALGEGNFLGTDYIDANGKLKTNTNFYKLLSENGAIESDGMTVNLGILGGVNNIVKKEIKDSASFNADFINEINSFKDTKTGESYADLTINANVDASSLATKEIKAKNITISADIKGLNLDTSKASEKSALFIDKTFGSLNIEGKADSKITIENESIKSNEIKASNATIKTSSLIANNLNLENVTIDTTASSGETFIASYDKANLNGLKINTAKDKLTIITLKEVVGEFSSKDINTNSTVTLLARVAKVSENDIKVVNGKDGSVSYIIGDATNSELAKALENGASIDEAILVKEGILTSDLKISDTANQITLKELEDNGVLKVADNGSVSVDSKDEFEKLVDSSTPSIDSGKTEKNNAAVNLAHTALNQAKFAYTLEINNMTKRLGEIRNLEGDVGVWTRAYGGKGAYKDYQDIKYYSFTIGADKFINDDMLFGLSFGYNKQSLSKNISGNQNTYVLSAYASKMFENGFYLDGVVKYLNSKGKYENDVLGNTNNKKLDSKAQNIFLGSIELGYRMPITQSVIIEPQAEFITGYIPSNTISSDIVEMKSDAYVPLNIKTGLNTIYKANDKIDLRAGIGGIFDLNDGKVKYTIKDSFGTKDTRTGKDSRGFVNLFGAYKVNDNTRLNLEVERTFGGDFKLDYNVNFNLRYQF